MERDGRLLHPRNKYIKDPGLDAVIQMQRQRVQRGLDIDKQKRSVAGISGGVLHKQLQLDIVEKEKTIKSLWHPATPGFQRAAAHVAQLVAQLQTIGVGESNVR